MKKTIIIALLFVTTTVSAQTDDPVWNYENRIHLQSKGKVELAKLYMLQIEILMHNCYLMPLFDTLPNIPATRKTDRAFNNMIRSTGYHMDEIYRNMSDMLPYADKNQLVEAIIEIGIINDNISKFQTTIQNQSSR
jgi:hypothetical protein